MLLLVTLFFVIGTVASSIFTIVPETQYVYLNHNVTFECATNLTGYTPRFSNGGYDNKTILPGGGMMITKTFTVTSAKNGIYLRCYIKENPLIYTPYAFAYAQGPPEAVSDLQGCQLDNCCIVFSWSPPFTLGQLSVWYQVTLSVGEEMISSEVIYTTNYTYCPIDLTNGEYRLNITTMNGAGTGISNSNTTIFKTDKKINVVYNNHLTYRQDNDWIYHFKITPSTHLCTQPIMNTTVMSCNLKNSSDCYNSTNVTIINDSNGYKSMISVIDLPPREKFNTRIILEYESGQIFQTTPVVTSSHNLQQLIITNISNDILCLQFIFVNGSTKNEVLLHLENDKESYPLGNGYHDNQFSKCFVISDIPSGNWTLYVCDGVLPNVSDTCSNPAVILTDITITGKVHIVSPSTDSTSVDEKSSSLTYDSNTTSPTTNNFTTEVIIAIVISPAIVLFFMVSGVVLVAAVLIKKKRCIKKSLDTHEVRNKHETDGNHSRNNQGENDPPDQETLLGITESSHYFDALELVTNNKSPTNTDTSPDLQDVMYSEIDLKFPTQRELKELVTSKVAHKWFPIGIGLGMSGEQLEEIQESSNDNPECCLGAVFYKWEQTTPKPFTWSTLVEVLKSEHVEEKLLANDLEERG